MTSPKPTIATISTRMEEMQQAINELQSQKNPPQPVPIVVQTHGVKTRDPEPFDGETPELLPAFISQVQLVLNTHPAEFPDEKSKIAYAVSYLAGGAFEWA